MSSHDHHHHHHHHVDPNAGDGRILWAVAVNLGLTVAQIVGGVLAGSLALIADAIHNLSDALSLVIALAARRIGRRPADSSMTFGYRRAEIIAALINLTTLIILGLYLIFEAVMRLIEPEPVGGWIVVWVAAAALVVDAVTAALTYSMSKDSLNIRAAFLHNLADAMGSVAVIGSGTVILLFGWDLADPLVTLLIAGYILYHGVVEIGHSIRILMGGVPTGIDFDRLVAAMNAVPDVLSVHHVHVWAIDEHRSSLEAHIVVRVEDMARIEAIKAAIKAKLADAFGIRHSTLEFEPEVGNCCGADPAVIAQEFSGAVPGESHHSRHDHHHH